MRGQTVRSAFEDVKACCWCLAITLVIVFSFVLLVIYGWPKLDSAAAAWVQAIGSLFGLGVAIRVASNQVRAQIERDEALEDGKRRGTQELLTQILNSVKNLDAHFKEDCFYVVWAVDLLRMSSDALSKIPLHEAPYSEFLDPVGHVLLDLGNLISDLERLREGSSELFLEDQHAVEVRKILNYYKERQSRFL